MSIVTCQMLFNYSFFLEKKKASMNFNGHPLIFFSATCECRNEIRRASFACPPDFPLYFQLYTPVVENQNFHYGACFQPAYRQADFQLAVKSSHDFTATPSPSTLHARRFVPLLAWICRYRQPLCRDRLKLSR